MIFLSFRHWLGWIFLAMQLQAGASGIAYDVHFPQAVVTPAKTTYIPFSLVGQLMVVEATVDSTTGYFILDTGSGHLVLNRQYFPAGANDSRVASVGNTGLVQGVRARRIDSLSIEGLTLRSIPAHVADLGHIERKKNIRLAGILGQEVWDGYDLMIDYPERYIVLIPVDKKGRRIDPDGFHAQPYDSLPFKLVSHVILVDTEINRVRIPMILDSGAELNLIDRHVPRRVLENFTVMKRVNMVGVGEKSVEVLAGVLRDVRIGNQVTASMNTLLTSLDAINEGLQVRAAGVLGHEFLKSRRILVSYRKEKLYFFQPVRS